MTSDPPPVPVLPLPLDYADPRPDRRRLRWLGVGRVAAALALACCAAAWLLIVFVKVESVIATGPVLAALGALCVVAGVVAGRRAFAVLGAAHAAVCVLFFALVNAFRWSPEQAREPFTWMGAIYTVAVVYPTVLACSRGRGNADGSA